MGQLFHGGLKEQNMFHSLAPHVFIIDIWSLIPSSNSRLRGFFVVFLKQCYEKVWEDIDYNLRDKKHFKGVVFARKVRPKILYTTKPAL